MASTSEKSSSGAKRSVEKTPRKRLHQQSAAAAAAAALQQEQQSGQSQPDNAGGKIAHEEKILEAIDQLRRRKARPDADRICNYLLRKFSVDARDTIADLHRLIETEKVIQVDYKGNTSYRNASKWTRLQLYKNRPEGFVKEKINSVMVSGAVAELVVEEPDYLEQGVPAFRLIEHLLDGMSNPTSRRMVEDFLGKEVANGNLARLSNGNYSLVDSSSNGAVAAQQNGDIVSKIKTSTPYKEPRGHYDLKQYEQFTEQHGNGLSVKGSRNSPKILESMKKEDCYEIIVGRRSEEEENRTKIINGKLDNGCHKDDSIKQNGRTLTPLSGDKEDEKTATQTLQTNHKRSKTERKQRLCVRSDDSTDLVFKYEEYRREPSYKDDDKRDDTNDRLSEDGDDAERSSANASPTHGNTSGRSARRKRARKVFDPSDNMVVKRKRGRQPNSAKLALLQDSQEAPPKTNSAKECSLCDEDKQEALTGCRDCTVRAHPSCICALDEMKNKEHTVGWQCNGCKTCCICYDTSEVGPMTICICCGEAYHHACHSPRIPASKIKWQCSNCTEKQVAEKQSVVCINNKSSQNSSNNWNNSNSEQHSNNSIAAAILTTHLSPTRNSTETVEDENSTVNIDPNIPDASDWSSEQVYQYFARLFPKDADVFRNQEIDGHSLMLLKRKDVLSEFDLLLGPALKIYRHVLKLQLRKDDPKYYWL